MKLCSYCDLESDLIPQEYLLIWKFWKGSGAQFYQRSKCPQVELFKNPNKMLLSEFLNFLHYYI